VAPRRSGPVVWVKDASRSVPVAAALPDDKQRPALLEAAQSQVEAAREAYDRLWETTKRSAGSPALSAITE